MRAPPLWEEVDRPAPERARALIDAVDGRADARRLGAWVDAHADATLRAALVEEGRRRGAELPDEAVDWPGKRLVRLARGQEGEARRRTTPIAVDEDFTCVRCGREVPAHGRTARNHCPWCLCSLHVDVVPGDRAAGCGGVLEPVGVDLRGETVTLLHRCARCGAERRVRALRDGEVPDDWSALVRLSAQERP